jgi:uncharacterized SAM-binding protein YcdF (DUF218 family)
MSGRRAAAATGVVAFIVIVIVSVVVLGRDAPARYLVVEDPPGPADAIVVMAGDPGYERTSAAARLMRAGDVPVLVLTGGAPGPGDSAESLRARAIALGVPPSRIRMETSSRSTRGALLAVAPILREIGAREVTLVTSPYHARRARGAACRAWPGLRVRSRPASPSAWAAEGWWHHPERVRVVLSEYLKLLYYGARGWIGSDDPAAEENVEPRPAKL